MNKTSLCLLALAVAAYSGQALAQAMDCPKKVDLDAVECEGEPFAPVITLNVKTMEATPQCVRAYRGTRLVIRLESERELKSHDVSIVPKKIDDFWLEAKNDEFKRVIFISIPGKHKRDVATRRYTRHDFNIIAFGVCLDPRVQVEH